MLQLSSIIFCGWEGKIAYLTDNRHKDRINEVIDLKVLLNYFFLLNITCMVSVAGMLWFEPNNINF